ncbi:guanylate kinase [uncultured Paludibacter sp.]|nr:guanylate kinase [uncultured Paludibacter sp.]
MQPKLIIVSAPSGAGKSTLVNYLLSLNLGLEFSVSATCRSPRGKEKHGKEYYFLTTEEFKQKIDNKEFIEYEEVYSGCYYGTLRSEIDRISAKGNPIIFDVDVLGGLNIKKQYGEDALAIFIAPPSIETLRQRLIKRSTDSPEMIEKRVGKAEHEMTFAPQFDLIIVNDNLSKGKNEIEQAVREFINKSR